MPKSLSSLKLSLALLRKDKLALLLSLAPILIGLALYSAGGTILLKSILDLSKQYIAGLMGDGLLGDALLYIVMGIVTIILFFIVNLTFVSIISLLSCPFNDWLSIRAQKFVNNGDMAITKLSVLKIIFNEIKKMLLILCLTIVALLLGMTQVLSPLGIFLSAIILSIQFLDYSWSRENLTSNQCKQELKSNFLNYGIPGLGFLALTALPVINLIVIPLGTIYYTIHRTQIKS